MGDPEASERDVEGGTQETRLSVAAPCFNEEDGIESVVRDWDRVLAELPLPTEIVLCNDGSSDGTAVVLESLARELPRLRVVHFEKNGGYGRALGAAIGATRGRFVATIDSDGQFDLRDALPMLEELEAGHVDCITGYRQAKRDSLLRVVADRGLNLLVRALFGVGLRDTNCALKVGSGEILRGLLIEARGYPTPTEICVRLRALGHRLAELPVSHHERGAGQSKLRFFETAWNMLLFLLYLRFRLTLSRRGIIVTP